MNWKGSVAAPILARILLFDIIGDPIPIAIPYVNMERYAANLEPPRVQSSV